MQALRFSFVGLLATLTHITIASLLLWLSGSPIWANTVAFFFAFWVSFFGHLRFSFPKSALPVPTSVRRFVVTSLLGLAVNQSTLIALLWLTDLSASVALPAAIVFAAILTFLLCRTWVFRQQL